MNINIQRKEIVAPRLTITKNECRIKIPPSVSEEDATKVVEFFTKVINEIGPLPSPTRGQLSKGRLTMWGSNKKKVNTFRADFQLSQ